MVKKSTKSKSKRVTLGEKYTRIRKAKQRLVKQKRQAKKEAKQLSQQGGRRPRRKEPGLPASWPFKEEFLKEMRFEKDRIQAQLKDKAAKKAQRKAVRAVDGDDPEEMNELEALKVYAEQRQDGFVGIEEVDDDRSAVSGRSTGASKNRAFYKEFKKVVELADVVIEVLDARDPMACRSLEVEEFVRSAGAQKRIILLLNKIDLVPHDVVAKWLKYLREEMPAIAFKSSTQKQHNKLGQAKRVGLGENVKTQMCFGAENLLQLLKNYARNNNIKTAITVGIVGMPNVGKSSVINSLKRTRVAHVGNRPGVTTSIQEIHLDKDIRLLDSPGIVVSKGQGPLQGAIKTEQVNDPIGLVNEILSKVTADCLAGVYKLESFQTADEFLVQLAAARGKLKKGGVPDKRAVAKMVLQDWNSGAIPYFTNPPERVTGKSVRLVQEWANDFNIDEMKDEELLASVQGIQQLEESMVQAMSGMDLVKTDDKAVNEASNLLESVSLAGMAGNDEAGKAAQVADAEEGKEQEGGSGGGLPVVFKGAEAAFEQMRKKSKDRQDMANVVNAIGGLLVEEGASSRGGNSEQKVGGAQDDGAAAAAPEPTKPKKKKRRKGEQQAAVPKLPKTLDAEDGGSDDEDIRAAPASSLRKRKKPAKKNKGDDHYGAEGQLDTQQARMNRKKVKKVKKKTRVQAGILADAVEGIHLGEPVGADT